MRIARCLSEDFTIADYTADIAPFLSIKIVFILHTGIEYGTKIPRTPRGYKSIPALTKAAILRRNSVRIYGDTCGCIQVSNRTSVDIVPTPVILW